MGPQSKPMSEKMAQTIDEEVRAVIDANYNRAETILKENIEVLHNMAQALMDWETIDKFQIDELLQGKKLAPPEPEVEEPKSFEEIEDSINDETGDQLVKDKYWRPKSPPLCTLQTQYSWRVFFSAVAICILNR
jgi:membrane protease FtsH catalytic subunit (EC 3.4.24.-)